MATHKSAIKKHRQSLDRRLRNRQHRSRLRGRIKAIRTAIEAGDVDTARGMLPSTLSLVDRTAKLGVIHDNAAARTKSRLTRAVNRAGSGS
jgi:small subunit ribosomal protein S20